MKAKRILSGALPPPAPAGAQTVRLGEGTPQSGAIARGWLPFILAAPEPGK